MRYTYLLVDFLAVLIPFLFSFHPKIRFNRSFTAFVKSNVIVSLIFIVWDIIFTRLNVWNFNPDYIIGFYLFNLPVEEILFFIFIPFSCTFTYYCLTRFYTFNIRTLYINVIFTAIVVVLLYFGFLNIARLYTGIAFYSTIIVGILIYYLKGAQWLGRFLIVYSVLLLPFLVVNGILTGTGIDAPVVRYNSAEIINFRILTIPIEDFVYGMELLILNIFFFDKFHKVADFKG